MADLLVVVRAGTTDFDLQGRIRGNLDIPLSPGGAVAALTAAHELSAAPPLALYTSTAACAMETATIVAAALRLPPRRVPNLPNIDQGLWQGMLVEEIRRRQPRLAWHWEADPWKVAPPDGELVGEEDMPVGQQDGIADLAPARMRVSPDNLAALHDEHALLLRLAGVKEIVLRQSLAGQDGGGLSGVARGMGGAGGRRGGLGRRDGGRERKCAQRGQADGLLVCHGVLSF